MTGVRVVLLGVVLAAVAMVAAATVLSLRAGTDHQPTARRGGYVHLAAGCGS